MLVDPYTHGILRSPKHRPKKPPIRPKQSITQAMQKPMESGRSLLLDLPAELRNSIYTIILEDHPTKLATPTLTLASTSAMPRVDKQTRKEFLSVIQQESASVTVNASDFDFQHAITMFNRLSNKSNMTLRHSAPMMPSCKEIRVELSFSDDVHLTLRADSLCRWMTRLEHSDIHGNKISISYKVHEDTKIDVIGMYAWQKLARENVCMQESRSKEELRRIMAALKQDGMVWR